ncbi:MAG: hypothetical protein IJ744_11835 [Lachnospiraceae bacterium]|nr:hypothetical protein [Lachnospiraceae bacterium]
MAIKEQQKANVVEAPTLFVGVGGTGSDIVRKVAEMCQPGEVENISFVCMDTNVNDLSTVENSAAKIYSIQTSTTQTVGDYLDYDEDALKNWFPKNAVMYDKTVSEGAGQVRAISRLALNSTIKTGAIAPLYDAIDNLFRKDGRSMKQAMRVVIVSTASGGTGSGIILPLSMFIRDYVKEKYPQTGAIVRGMILLPETLDSVIKSSVERDSQRRNAYATIKEINAFMMKGSGFCDIEGEFSRYRDLHVDVPIAGTDDMKSLSLLPFDFCFLLDGQNSEDHTLVGFDQYKTQAARALYEQNVGPMQKKAFSVEDNIIKEMSNPGKSGRNRFGGIGASVLKYPYDDIAEYIACGWAMEAIGGKGEAAKWSKYDEEFEIKKAEARKKGLSEDEGPKLHEVYVQTMDNATDNFSKDVRAKFLSNAAERVDRYFEALEEYMHENVHTSSKIAAAMGGADGLAARINYETNGTRGHAKENLELLRDFELEVNKSAKKIAESLAEGLFRNEDHAINAREPHKLEYLLKNAYGDVCHPNAARYFLYLVKEKMIQKVTETQENLSDVRGRLALYSDEANNETMFDVKKTKKSTEVNLDQMAEGESAYKDKYDGEYYDKLNQHFPAYYAAIKELCDYTTDEETYKIGSEFVEELCKAYEKFYRTFKDKVDSLERKQDVIVDSLKFHKGDSTLYICGTQKMLEELAFTTKNMSAEGALLDSELNGQIFDAIKKNVAFEREIRNVEIVENDERTDIFDDILLGYFIKSVKTHCESIDLNIVEAIAMENRLDARIKMRDSMGEEEGEKLFDHVSQKDNETYIHRMVEKGKRLAAPGIQGMRNEEKRMVECVAYNKSLENMRNYRVNDDSLIAVSNKCAVDTVSKYEMHFFNALYNITPDKLKKFSCHSETETGERNAGLYHNAYVSYAKNIGPDSTKNTQISTHIDKRWDSIATMPEIDFDFQKLQMMKVHQAMIYGLVHGMITYRKLSATAGKKRVYRYENSEERYMEMIVSNGTLCDEFYEILDSLYISSAMVEDIDVVRKKKNAKDRVRNADYDQTVFYNDLMNFKMETIHEGQASLFEIPVRYYNSLPNSRRFDDEISALIDAVIETLRQETYTWEKPEDARFILCDQLVEQFNLFMDNFANCEGLNANLSAMDHACVDMMFRKIKNVLAQDPEPDGLEDTLEAMKARIRA